MVFTYKFRSYKSTSGVLERSALGPLFLIPCLLSIINQSLKKIIQILYGHNSAIFKYKPLLAMRVVIPNYQTVLLMCRNINLGSKRIPKLRPQVVEGSIRFNFLYERNK